MNFSDTNGSVSDMDMDVKKGTTTVGIVCKEGIVLGADRRVTAGTLIAHKKIKKVVPVSDHMAMTTAGLVSDVQLFTKIIRAQLMLLRLRLGKEPTVLEASSLLASLAYSNIRRPSMILGIVGFLFAGYDRLGYHLYEISFDGTALEVDDFAADGSGSIIALGVLETLYKKDLSVEEGKDLVVRSLTTAIGRDSATGNGIDVVVVNEKGVTVAIEKEIKVILK